MSLGEPSGVNTVIKGLPEPYAKRTVEGDIGMRYSAAGIVEAAGIGAVSRLSGLSAERAQQLLTLITDKTDTLPENEELAALDFALASLAVKVGMTRHAGHVEKVYTPVGETWLQEGKDLTAVEKAVITGGSLIHAKNIEEIARGVLYDVAEAASLKPRQAEILLDKAYILSAMGLLAKHAPDTALRIMKKELISYGIEK